MNTFSRAKIKLGIKGAAAFAGCAAMIRFPSDAVDAAGDGVTLWLNVVVPAMLPFFVFSNYMMRLGIPDTLGAYAGRAFDFVFRSGRHSAFVFFAAVMSGYPMGAKLTGDLYSLRKISRDEAKRMLSFCCTSGPLFMLGAVGVGMLHSAEAGAVIALSHYAGALINGLIYSIAARRSNRSDIASYALHTQNRKTENVGAFSASILDSLRSLGIICVYIVLFSIATHLIDDLKLLDCLRSDELKMILKGMLEFTVGCGGIASDSNVGMIFKITTCTFLISFGGLSVIAQSVSVMGDIGVSPLFFIKTKLTHAFFSTCIAFAACMFLTDEKIISVSSDIIDGVILSIPNYGSKGLIPEPLGYLHTFLFSSKMCILFMILFAMSRLCSYLFGVKTQNKSSEVTEKNTDITKKRRKKKRRSKKKEKESTEKID